MTNDTREACCCNLRDAGCSPEEVAFFQKYEKEGATEDVLHLLRVHRGKLLDNLHEEQKKLDCLDYLIYRIQGEMKETK